MNLDEMQLPLRNENEELEQLSKDKLRPLLPHHLFEFREETYRDKGLDIIIELKHKNKYTNFRGFVQLKATESSEKNSDGSFSLSIDTSNIQYLLNSGLPSFYIIYLKKEDIFLFEDINNFVLKISKDEKWHTQGSLTLRTLQKFDSDKIYGIILKECKRNRNLRDKFIERSAKISQSNNIIIDINEQVVSDLEIQELIENYGFYMINEGKSKQVLELHEKASQQVGKSAKYNLTLGIACYYLSKNYDALSFLSQANRTKQEFDEYLLENFLFFDTTLKFQMNLISELTYQEQLTKIKKSVDFLALIQIENFKNSMSQNGFTYEKFTIFENNINTILSDTNLLENTKLIARCELNLFRGYTKNSDFNDKIMELQAMEATLDTPFLYQRIENVKSLLAKNKVWFDELETLNNDLIQSNNYFYYYLCKLNAIRIIYEFEVHVKAMPKLQKIDGIDTPNYIFNQNLLDSLVMLEECCSYFFNIGHHNNYLVGLSLQFELLHYFEKYQEASKLAFELLQLSETLEDENSKLLITKLLNGGTKHETFRNWLSNISEKADVIKQEIDEMMTELENLDKIELDSFKKISSFSDYHMINLFPIGSFIFLKSDVEKLFRLLKIDNESVIQNLTYFFSNNIIPVVNILYNKIEEVGYREGKRAHKGLASFMNIYRIRKALYDNKFYRSPR